MLKLRSKVMPPRTELDHHLEVAKWLKRRKRQVPIFRTDYAAGLKLTGGQARNHTRLQSGPGYPDLFIPKAVGEYHGLYIELKKDRDAILNKDGSMKADKHLRQQLKVLMQLRDDGYAAAFAVGHTQAKQVINDYFAGQKIFPQKYLLPDAPADLKLEPVDDLPF
jgi:hypothetical protein